MVYKFLIFMTWKNYLRPQFVKSHKREPLTNKTSPAQSVGIEDRVLSFFEFYNIRYLQSQVPINEEWKLFLSGAVPYPRVQAVT